MDIIGISAYYHDSAVALLRDGEIVFAAQEERFSRKKHDAAFPKRALKSCLDHVGISLQEIDHIVFYDKPILKFDRLLDTYFSFVPSGFSSFKTALPVWLKDKLFQKTALAKELSAFDSEHDFRRKLLFSEHHMSHAASAFYPSPFEEALILTLDGVGERATTSAMIGRGNQIEILKEIHFPHSLGLLYSALTYYLGFKVNSGEYKMMGLAPYGQPRYASLMLDNLIDLKADGSYWLDQSYFNYCIGLTMTNAKFAALFGNPRREPEQPLEQFHMDMASSVQRVIEKIILRLARSLSAESGMKNLCLAGGVALNCVANGKLLRENVFDDIWVQPAAGDAGAALGAALAVHHQFLGAPRKRPSQGDSMQGAYLGPCYSDSAIVRELEEASAAFQTLDDDQLLDATATALVEGKSVGWFQGRMEFGPRALGARSILANPQTKGMQSNLNQKIKFRESFRPFAPAVLAEECENWFNLDRPSPYMLMVAKIAESQQIPIDEASQELFGIEQLNVARSTIPAVTHVDYSARVQTVHAESNPRFHALLSRFKEKTGCPVLVNTSFNIRGEPIVDSPTSAFRCFMGTDLDVLVVGNCVLNKAEQKEYLKFTYHTLLDPD